MRERTFTRRRLVALSGTAAALGLAGCVNPLGDEEDGGGSQEENGGGGGNGGGDDADDGGGGDGGDDNDGGEEQDGGYSRAEISRRVAP